MNERSGKILWVDFIRTIAILSVLVLHSAGPLMYKYNEVPLSYWWAANIYDSIVRMCIPLFFMLSGFLLLGKKENLKTFFTKRLNKVIIPLAVWSIFYVLWKAYYEKSSALSLNSFCNIFLQPSYYHLWFLYAIIGIYLYVPILRIIVHASDTKQLYYFTALWFLAVSIIPFAEELTGIASKIDLAAISGFAGYLVLGYLLGKMKVTKKIAYYAFLDFCIFAGITAIGASYATAYNKGILVHYFYGYLSPNVIIMSAALFVFLKYLSENSTFLKKEKIAVSIRAISSASLGIYLVHVIFIYLLHKGHFGFYLGVFHGNPVYAIPLTAVTAFVLSFISVYILRKIPLVNKSVP